MALIVLSAAALFAAVAGARLGAPAPAAPAGQQAEEVEVVTVTPQGFMPAEITRPHAPFILAVHDNSGEEELSLRLERVQGDRVSEVKLKPEGHGRSHQRLHLPKGEYVLTEAGHPEWVCRINVTDNE